MINIAVVMAMAEEMSVLSQILEKNGFNKTRPHSYENAKLRVTIIRCGVKVSKMKLLEKKKDLLKQCDYVLIAGICGASCPDYRIGELVIPDYVCQADDRAKVLRNHKSAFDGFDLYAGIGRNPLRSCRMLGTSDHLAGQAEKAVLRAGGIDVVDMESYRIFEWMAQHKIAVSCMRTISDTFTQRFAPEHMLIEFMRGRLKFLIKNFYRKPIICYRLINIYRTSNKAMRLLARYILQWLYYIDSCNDIAERSIHE